MAKVAAGYEDIQTHEATERKDTTAPLPAPVRSGGSRNGTWNSLSIEFREMLVYMTFLLVYVTTTFGSRTTALFFSNEYFNQLLFVRQFAPDTTFYDIASTGDVVDWMTNMVVPTLYPPSLNGSIYSDDRIAYGQSVRIGLARIRLLRVENNTCSVPSQMQGLMVGAGCYGPLSEGEAKDDFMGIKWQSESQLSGSSMTSTTTDIEYPGSGYAINIPTDSPSQQAFLDMLAAGSFIDYTVRAFILEFSAYNPPVTGFVVGTALIEFLPEGVLLPTSKLRVSQMLRVRNALNGQGSNKDEVMVGIEAALYIIVVVLMFRVLVVAWRTGPLRFVVTYPSRLLEIATYGIALATALLRFFSLNKVASIMDDLTAQDRYVDLVSAADAELAVDGLNSFNSVVCTLRLLHVLRASPQLAQFTETLIAATRKLWALLIVGGVTLVAFGVGFNLGFEDVTAEYRTFSQSVLTLFKSTLGDIEMDSFRDSNRVLGPFLFGMFVIIMAFTIMSMFLTIVNCSYEEVQTRLLSSGNRDPIRDDAVFLCSVAWSKTKRFIFRKQSGSRRIYVQSGDSADRNLLATTAPTPLQELPSISSARGTEGKTTTSIDSNRSNMSVENMKSENTPSQNIPGGDDQPKGPTDGAVIGQPLSPRPGRRVSLVQLQAQYLNNKKGPQSASSHQIASPRNKKKSDVGSDAKSWIHGLAHASEKTVWQRIQRLQDKQMVMDAVMEELRSSMGLKGYQKSSDIINDTGTKSPKSIFEESIGGEKGRTVVRYS